MATARRDSPPEAGVRWRSVRGGLAQLAITFGLLTLVAVGSRLWSLDTKATVAGASTDEARAGAVVTFLLFGLAYQLVYSLLSASLAMAAVRITRAPRASGAVTPALVAAVGFAALVLVVMTLLTSTITPEDQRQLEPATIARFWFAAVVARTLALAALAVALIQLARHLKAPFATRQIAALLSLLAIDSGASLYGLLSPGAAATARGALLLVQLGFAGVLIAMAWRLRRVVAPLADAERDSPRAAPREAREPEPERERVRSEPPAAATEPDISPAARLLAALLAAAAGALLPFWDASEPRMRFELGAPSLALSGTLALAGVVAGLWVFRELGNDAYRARLALGAAALVGLGYAGSSLHSAAIARSRLTDRLPVCESGEPPGREALNEPLLSLIEGPRLESGTPCTRYTEHRDEHLQAHPKGSFRDGVVQIARRYTADRPRIIGGTLFVLAALLLAGVLVFRAAPPELERDDGARRKSSPDPEIPE